ncbi:hypothetical protein D6C84_06857 [Aureobasidium pullulans]|uniref:Zn(2)-C6 fungal-type domain-containing protein n=1 Tax=Aureobasidium pullulans TaxID=5580 RepID=A0A4S9NB18_AURPU|nr:hypothetical protein D6D21_02202 [Aureobasidium pullulans]THW93135.1 hypothetical protein D6D15_02671 [Aureobasidium pullulans]THX53760.1 hypothetical protein D6D06_05907 [Aureobasidium pullulans]THX93054.1 hypothetical protein D6D08_02239 [Aureobasidium pullulans]THY09919.1 hypothetical protein D6D03_00218 [Aureobasidium pullulans]
MAPRSTGCANCRKRKIKCDEGRPGCKKCQIHNTPCPGYRGMKTDGLEWRDETLAVAKRVERGWRSGSSSSSDSDSGAPVPPTERVRALSLVEKPVATEYTVIPQAIFSAATNRSQMFDVSMRLYRPTTLDEQPKRAHISDFSCLQKTINSKSSPALLAAVDTISLLQLGVSYQDQTFFEHARRRYGQALTCLVVALNKPDVLGNNDVLGAMKLLEFCELFRPVAQQGSWISHVNGVENFLVQRGPVPLKTELDNMLFFHARHSSTFPLAVDFPDFLTGYLQSIYWLYLFTIQRTLQDVLLKYPNGKCSISMGDLNKQILQIAIYMCQMMPYFCEPDASSMGRFATFMPLVFALKYFEARGMKAQQDWCQDVTDAMFNDGINPPWKLDLEKGLKPGEKKQIP